MANKYKSPPTHKSCEFADYTNEQIMKLVDSVQSNHLERKDLIDIIRELAFRNVVLEKSVNRF